MISFEEFTLKDLTLKNKILMPPMCMYSSDTSGRVKNFHHTHYEARAIGGVGLIVLEATAVSPNGRITDNDLGIWEDSQVDGLKNLVRNLHFQGTKVAIQLAHAGRKSRSTNKVTLAPSPLAYDKTYDIPSEMTKEDIKSVIEDFKAGAIRAKIAGFDAIEIHAAHGYLIHEFLSPISNKRTDAYGGSTVNRARFLKELLGEVKKVWPGNKPIFLRVSATDHIEGGLDIKETIKIINQVKPFIDLVHVSTGGLAPAKIKLYPGYQVEYSKSIKEETNLPTIAVGLIEDIDQVNSILSNKEADLVALGRLLLREPQFVINTAYKNKLNITYPKAYINAYR